MRRTRVTLPGHAVGVIAAAGVITACGGAPKHTAANPPSKLSDPPLLVPWSRVGDIRLGEPQKEVFAEYGGIGQGYHLYDRGAVTQGYYRLHGSRIEVDFQDGRVNGISFSTRYYRAKNGFGVGSMISRLGDGYVRNPILKEDRCGCWVKVGTGKRSLPTSATNFGKPWAIFYFSHGRVTSVYLAWKYVD